MNKALFIDRDGVINKDHVHVFRKEDFDFNESIFEICRRYADDGYLFIVITNQAGIAKGIYSEEDFQDLTAWMKEEFRRRGLPLAEVYHCPHHPDYTGPCSCRKPEPGMILNAIEDFNLDITRCSLIGDRETDLEAGRRAGIADENLILYSIKG
jgi:D-glycero-D-manno-heptose 1,7-bisphosphate phosphatase